MPERPTTSCRRAGVQGAREIMPDYRRGTIVSCTAGDGACAVTLWYSNTYACGRRRCGSIAECLPCLPFRSIRHRSTSGRQPGARMHARTHARTHAHAHRRSRSCTSADETRDETLTFSASSSRPTMPSPSISAGHTPRATGDACSLRVSASCAKQGMWHYGVRGSYDGLPDVACDILRKGRMTSL